MQKINNTIRFSPSDLVNFLSCPHHTTLDLRNLEEPLQKADDELEAALYGEKGIEHERAYLSSLEKAGSVVVDLSGQSGDGAETRVAATRRALESGAETIYQAALSGGQWIGYADFLRRVDEPSALGSHGYEPIDTKLASQPKAKFLIQLCAYSDLLAEAQIRPPHRVHLVLGDGSERSFRAADFAHYYCTAKRRFLEFVSARPETYPIPCEHCSICRWRELCKTRWLEDDHLSQVANITRTQMRKLDDSGIRTMKALSRLNPADGVPRIAPETLVRLRTQATLQVKARETGERQCLLLAQEEGNRGFARLPRPDAGDLFFDMEGDPLYPEGLEYLFGVYQRTDSQGNFQAFWAHNHFEEKRAFEAFVDFLADHLAQHPNAHVYHYAHYEETALKRLMSRYGTREQLVDKLLRERRLVDLYKVVRESLMVSEPGYSIKDIEHFYMEAREAKVKTAGGSIVVYEQWRKSRDSALLQEIAKYNHDDCRSTYLLHEWLLTLRPKDLPWFNEGSFSEETAQISTEVDVELARYEERLLNEFPRDPVLLTSEQRYREHVYHLLSFHRREAKPDWWEFFARQDMGAEGLIEDSECLGGLQRIDSHPAASGRSTLHRFTFPEQETKFKMGDKCRDAATGESLGSIEAFDLDRREVVLKVGSKRSVAEALSLMPEGPVNAKALIAAVLRFADSVIAGDGRYRAVENILRREPPIVSNRADGEPIADGNDVRSISNAVLGLQNSYLFIQGPPGSGKTYTGSNVIVRLLAEGYRVGVTSNSHKAINNLLRAVEQVASEQGLSFRGAKKSDKQRRDTQVEARLIENVYANEDVHATHYQLIAGTAWLFSDPNLDQAVDYLFIDEAGQVSQGNLVAMGTAARNIVLLGDQMQLAQPIKGAHPGRTGESVLDYLLDGEAVIAPERGVFLATTRRMHENVCRFISQAVYDDRLRPHPDNNGQCLLLDNAAHPDLCPTGVRFLELEHEGRSQRCPEEAAAIRGLFENLLTQRYRDRNGAEYQMGIDNILVISPYNMQVNLLTSMLPEGARVGTVDKFQGQEAEVVILSMATSSAEDLPRNIEFLYSKNRLNVAVSRARCLAVVVANPSLLGIPCHTVEQMKLVNTLCWLREYGQEQRCNGSLA